jgi:hypothetical protein
MHYDTENIFIKFILLFIYRKTEEKYELLKCCQQI